MNSSRGSYQALTCAVEGLPAPAKPANVTAVRRAGNLFPHAALVEKQTEINTR